MSEAAESQVDQPTGNQHEPEVDSPEYIQKMTERAGDSSVEDLNDQKDSLILGKFKDTDALAEAYKELESKLGQQSDQQQSEADESSKESTDDSTSTEEQSLELERPESKENSDEDAGSIFEEFGQRYAENGGFSDEDYEALAEKGYPKEVVQVYEQGLRAINKSRTDAAVEAVGGADEFKRLQQWAGQNLSDAEMQAFNRQLSNAQSAEEIGILYGTLSTRYRANAGEANLVKGSPSTPKGSGFASKAELVKAMSDERYGNDPTYTKEVEQRVMYSDFL